MHVPSECMANCLACWYCTLQVADTTDIKVLVQTILPNLSNNFDD